MKRREFIKQAAALGVGIPFLSLLLESCNKEADLFPEFDVNFSGRVLVIGAGAAGLTAGYLLDRYNIDFQILEASSVHGGRLKRDTSLADFPIDLGAEWIHTDPSILARLLSDPTVEGDIDVITYSPETVYTWDGETLSPGNFGSNFYGEYKFKNTSWYGFFEDYMVPKIGSRILYDCPVTEIDYSGSMVRVTNADGDVFEADRIVLTVPLKILQSGSIQFNPALPSAKESAIASVSMPDGLKVFMEFSEKFYPDLLTVGTLLGAGSGENGEEIYYNAAFRKDTSKNILGLFTVGSKASAYTDLGTDAAIMTKIMTDLDKMFDGKASETYLRHVVQNWSAEPYIQGSYSIDFAEDYTETINTLKEPIDNKVYFAGEVYAQGNSSTVHGASETAYEAIEAILKT